MIADPALRGVALARLFADVSPRLFRDLVESDTLPASADRAAASCEWECFALYACVRGLVAAGGFNQETATAIDALHADALATPNVSVLAGMAADAARARLSERYAEYGAIGQAGGAGGAATVDARLGEAAARHVAALAHAPAALAEVLAGLHESLVDAATTAVRGGRIDFMFHAKSHPPRAPLDNIVGRLESAGIVCALGGSGLLAELGLGSRVRDWDLTTDTPLDEVLPVLAGLPFTRHGNDALHADEKLELADGDVDLISRFAFHVNGGVVRIPTVVVRRVEGVPLGSAEAWAVAYALLDRPAKRDLLLDYLTTTGARADIVEALLAQPLPSELAARLRALPTSRAT